jgi:hypothetical protein
VEWVSVVPTLAQTTRKNGAPSFVVDSDEGEKVGERLAAEIHKTGLIGISQLGCYEIEAHRRKLQDSTYLFWLYPRIFRYINC